MKKIFLLLNILYQTTSLLKAQEYSWADDRYRTEYGRQQVLVEAIQELDGYFKDFVTEFGLKLNNERYTTECCEQKCYPEYVYFYDTKATIKVHDRFCNYYIATDEQITCESGDFACYTTIQKPTIRYMLLTPEEKNNLDNNGRTSKVPPTCDLTVDEKEYFRTHMPASLFEKYKFILPVTDMNNIPRKGFDKTERYLVISPKIFRLGYLDIDPEKSILWDADYNTSNTSDNQNLYYRYAENLVEAIQFLIFHEYAHIMHQSNEEAATELAKNLIIQLRRAKREEHYSTILIDNLLYNPIPSYGNFYHAYHSKGSPPPKWNLPPGTNYK